MKVLFLDIDGVVNTGNWIHVLHDMCKPMVCADYYFDPSCMSFLKRFIEATGYKVVISSTWRLGKEHWGAIEANFVHNFICVSNIIGKTPNLFTEDGKHRLQRGEEISAYIETYNKEHQDDPITDFVVVDDDSDMKGVEDHFVKTRFDTGLNFEAYSELMKKAGLTVTEENTLNKKLLVRTELPAFVLDAVKEGEVSKGGAETKYTIQTKDGTVINSLKFQDKPVSDGVNGVTNELLLEIIIDRLADFQAGPFPCAENAEAVMYAKRSLNALLSRHRERISRDVYGKYEK